MARILSTGLPPKGCPGVISPWGWGIILDGSEWPDCPDTFSHTILLLSYAGLAAFADRWAFFKPDALGWTALLDCRMRMTSFYRPEQKRSDEE